MLYRRLTVPPGGPEGVNWGCSLNPEAGWYHYAISFRREADLCAVLRPFKMDIEKVWQKI